MAVHYARFVAVEPEGLVQLGSPFRLARLLVFEPEGLVLIAQGGASAEPWVNGCEQ